MNHLRPRLFGFLALLTGLPGIMPASDPVASGSLWRDSRKESRSMYSDRKASRVGDILTVTVLENTQATASARTSTDRDASLNDEIARLLFSSQTSGRLTSGGELPGMQWGGTNQYTAGGEINNRQNLNSRAAVLVTDVLPNGNLVVEGVRKVIFSNENTFVYIRGLVRADDVRGDNTVLSSDIAEAHVEFVSEGSISDTQRKGWLTRIYDIINPF